MRYYKLPPTAEARDVARAGDCFRLDQKTFDRAAVGQFERADRERRRHRGDEVAECGI